MANALIFLYLVIFPFGQLLRINLAQGIVLQPLDIVTFIALIYVIIKKQTFPKYLIYVLIAFIFPSLFLPKLNVVGLMYFFRLAANLGFFVFIYHNFKGGKDKKLIFNSLLAVITVVAAIAWLQYFFIPDLRALKVLGWDDHLFRLIGTFLDPTFTGIILVLGFFMALGKKSLWLVLFLLVTIAFTYSRASYLALGGGLMLYALWQKKYLQSAVLILIFGVSIILLPRPASEGVQLMRTKSIGGRVTSYSQALKIIKASPVFGVGFNNYCWARQIYLKTHDLGSHSCGGSDSSLLNILATSGVIGLLVFLTMVSEIWQRTGHTMYRLVLGWCFTALLIHALFSNSLFYPWVMGVLAVIAGLAIRNRKQ